MDNKTIAYISGQRHGKATEMAQKIAATVLEWVSKGTTKVTIDVTSQETVELREKLKVALEALKELQDGHDPEVILDTRQCLEIIDRGLGKK